MERNICWYYNTKNGCRNGNQCPYRHTKIEKSQMPKCRYFRGPGTCLYGSQCFFRHDNESSSNSSESSTTTKNKAEESEPVVKAECESPCVDDVGELAGAVGGDGNTKNRKSPKSKEKYLSVKFNNKVQDDTTPRNSAKQKVVNEGGDNNNDIEESGEDIEGIDKENKTVTCGECGVVLSDVVPPSDENESFQDELEKHYKEMFLKLDKKHMSFLDKDPRFKLPTSCGVCGRYFVRVKALLAHITDKVKSKKNDWKMHEEFLEAFLMAFWERDCGLSDETEMLDSLLLHLVESYEGEDSDDADSDTGGIEALFGLMALGKILHGGHAGFGYGVDSDDSYGMDDDDIYELACQGIKPWDPEAHAALAILNGEDDYF